MNTFKINSSFDKQDFIRIHLVKWKILLLKNRKQLINFSITSLILLTIGLIARTEYEPINIFIILGIIFLIFTIYLFYLRIFSRKNYSKKIMQIAEKYDSIKMDCSYEFSDESIKYWDKEKTIEFKWSVFNNYSTYKNYLLINLSNSLIDSYIFEKNDMEIDEYNKILEITKSKLDYKEIK